MHVQRPETSGRCTIATSLLDLIDSSHRRCQMTVVELFQAEGQLKKLVEEAEAGQEVIITRDGKPVARLVAPEDSSRRDRVPGSAKGLFTVPDDFDAPLDDFRDYM
ncbi:MAG TPA: type II toxin-antitoxin system Phd/YefM family antitoxin [Longimicrobium sp.]|nr:type II toxin-antitoxin system Phd/YefM family antitoxin [Longimicrobium sp.]